MSEESVSSNISERGIFEEYKLDIIILLSLFLFIIFIKILFINWFNTNIGDFYYLTKTDGAAVFLRKILLANPTEPIPTQAYDDIWHHYIPYVEAFSQGWNPYTNSGLPNDSISGNYNYGPLYIVFISFGSIVFNIEAYYSIYWSNLIFDVSGMLVFYLIVRHYRGKLLSIYITLLLSFSPVMLFYVDFKLFNMPQVTFFTLLFFLLFIKGRHNGAVISLAFGFMTKFIPMFLMAPLVVYYWRVEGRKFALNKILVFAIYSFVIMFPFFILSPSGFMNQFLNAGAPYQEEASLINSLISQLKLNIGFLLWFILLALFIYFGSNRYKENDYLKLRMITYFLFGTHATFYGIYTRGFKYYDPLILPFFLLTIFIYNEKKLNWLAIIFSTVLFYLTNVLIINLPPFQATFNHFRFFFVLLTGLYFIWVVLDFRSELKSMAANLLKSIKKRREND